MTTTGRPNVLTRYIGDAVDSCMQQIGYTGLKPVDIIGFNDMDIRDDEIPEVSHADKLRQQSHHVSALGDQQVRYRSLVYVHAPSLGVYYFCR